MSRPGWRRQAAAGGGQDDKHREPERTTQPRDRHRRTRTAPAAGVGRRITQVADVGQPAGVAADVGLAAATAREHGGYGGAAHAPRGVEVEIESGQLLFVGGVQEAGPDVESACVIHQASMRPYGSSTVAITRSGAAESVTSAAHT